MSHDPYADLAERYDLFRGPFGQHDDNVVQFFRTLSADHHVGRVLDCACGTGHDLPLFHSLGCQVVGSDISQAMLSQARENLEAHGLGEVPLHRLDYRQLPQHFAGEFDAVVCLSSSILHMPDECETLRACKSIRGVLREGGILVLSQGTTDRQWQEKPRFIMAVNRADVTRLFVIDYFEQGGARYNVLDIIHKEEERDFKVWSFDYPQMLLRDDYERLLQAVGFKMVTFYGDYQFNPYDKERSQRLITVAQT